VTSTAGFVVGIDVGSTTTKVVVAEDACARTVWQGYRRHEARQAETLHAMLLAMSRDAGVAPARCRAYMTGVGSHALARAVGAHVVQEVHALSLAVEALHPDARSVVELGGQNAKVVLFADPEPGRPRRKIPSMNDRCAGGTGAVIDKIAAKLGIPQDALAQLAYAGRVVHPIAAKCGVFAETDINSLQKLGVCPEELMASLFDAIVLQNLAVLTRGHTLRPRVLLVGGPNAFLRGLREAWQHHVARLWHERGVRLPDDVAPADLVTVPADAQYFAAIGAVRHGLADDDPAAYAGVEGLERHLSEGRDGSRARTAIPGLVASREEAEAFRAAFAPPPFVPPELPRGGTVRGFIGIDGGSTSTKGVVLAEDGRVVGKAYRLSGGNPIEDTVDIIGRLRRQVEAAGATLDVLGVATTGYARALLRDVFRADVAVVETVAHAEAAQRYHPDPHVVVDVGGQDIKILRLRDGRIVDFRLNTQCSAGDGFFLQNTAESFGVAIDDYADVALSAPTMPALGYGCAVFLQTDIVNLQRLGWGVPEMLAGLANVLPKNVFLYVAKTPNLARLGTRFVLQGATQRNLAVVKAEVDFIRASFGASGAVPEIVVHEHCGECGAIGAALEAQRLWQAGRATTFIGLDAAERVAFRTTRSEATRCPFCKNACLRTFVDVWTGEVDETAPQDGGPVPLRPGERRLIVAQCEKGAAGRLDEVRGIKAELDGIRAANPNFLEIAAREAWTPQRPPLVADPAPRHPWLPHARRRADLVRGRSALRVGMPRVLYMYGYAPLFSAYLESLGVAASHIVYSEVTSDGLYRAGCSRGSIDPCFPAKVALAHVHNLLWVKHPRARLDCLFFPMIDVLTSPLPDTRGCNACPTATLTPETVKAAFTKERDHFAEQGIRYLGPLLDLSHRRLFAQQMFEAWSPVLGLSEAEHDRAVAVAFEALGTWQASLRRRARETLDGLVREQRLGIVALGRVYHHDPGVNHDIPEALQRRGYPVFSQATLPMDDDLLEELFGEEVRAGLIAHPLDLSDVWKHTTSASTNLKLWAAKFVARHPNLVAVELSSFKCGLDAPIYNVVEEIVATSGTPYFAFKDLDENKATGSIALRVETIDYFLTRHRAALVEREAARREIERRLEALEARLRARGARASTGGAGRTRATPQDGRTRTAVAAERQG
jgi:activator of 2-hydroxyglutaryl-CoA dehydratase/predicted nucleotide-binding protein (sugar kinase/HSP70/actin superfamily)